MSITAKNQAITILIFICTIASCEIDNNDSDEIGSMHPIEGYTLASNIEEIKAMLKEKCIDAIEFNKGEVVADIGAGNGNIVAMLSVITDSLIFYIQDIDTGVCNQKNFNEILDYYQKIKKRPITNKFVVINGTDTETGLPNDIFDKIMMMWTYQYLKNPRKFLTDIKGKLKENGILYVINPEMDYEYAKVLTEKYGWNAATIEKEISDIIDCGFELIKISRNYINSEQPYIMVFKKKCSKGLY